MKKIIFFLTIFLSFLQKSQAQEVDWSGWCSIEYTIISGIPKESFLKNEPFRSVFDSSVGVFNYEHYIGPVEKIIIKGKKNAVSTDSIRTRRFAISMNDIKKATKLATDTLSLYLENQGPDDYSQYQSLLYDAGVPLFLASIIDSDDMKDMMRAQKSFLERENK